MMKVLRAGAAIAQLQLCERTQLTSFVSRVHAAFVAQICTLLYRRFEIGWALLAPTVVEPATVCGIRFRATFWLRPFSFNFVRTLMFNQVDVMVAAMLENLDLKVAMQLVKRAARLAGK